MSFCSDLVSVVMPCFNAAPYVREAMRSVIQQSYRHVELIVVDDGSQDNSAEVIASVAEQHPERVRFHSQERRGPYPARNLGLSLARGEFIAFLDADDWWEESFLEKLLTGLEEDEADLVYCGWQNVGERAKNSEPYIPPAYEQNDPVVSFLRNCPWPIHAAVVRRAVLTAIEGFSERRFSSMDYDLWLRVLGHTRRIVRVPEVLAFYRWHGSGQISENRSRQVLDAVQVRRDFVRQFPEIVGHLSAETVRDLVEGEVLREAYRAYWRRDLHNAQKLFRVVLKQGMWQGKDLRYLLLSLLPERIFQQLVTLADQTRKVARQ